MSTDTSQSDFDNSSEILDKTNYIGPVTDKLVKDFIHEIRKEKNMDRIRSNVIDPVLHDINDRYFPHMASLITLLIVIILLLTLLLAVNYTSKSDSNSITSTTLSTTPSTTMMLGSTNLS